MRPTPDRHPSNQHVRRIVLPSGKTIEVVYFEQHPALAGREADLIDMHVCAACASPLVHPVDWEESGPRHWEVTVRCPECEHVATGVYDQATVDRFDEILDDGIDTILRDLKRLTRANMEGEIERFVAALDADLILPEDF